MEGTMQEEGETKIVPEPIRGLPLRKDVVGDAGYFIDNFMEAAKNEMAYKAMGTQTDKSFLITGPAGNGKTLATEALINEMNKKYRTDILSGKNSGRLELVGFKYETGKYGTAYINRGPRVLQSFFDTCFGCAVRGYKTLAIFDEAEVLFGKRADSLSSHKEDVKNLETIMLNMQRAHDMDNVYVVMMSNFPEAFDEASIRAGRVDKRMEFVNPNTEERIFAYENAIQGAIQKAGSSVIRNYDTGQLAELSSGFSYSDIKESVNAALKQKAREICKETPGGEIVNLNRWITQPKLISSIKNHREMFRKGKSTIGF